MDKLETLKSALEGRNDEIMSYQINIDNYERAIAKINEEHSDNPAMIEFRDRMNELLLSSRTEKLKASVIRDVIADQVNEIEAS
jgi:chemotaxis regulatin CheY-phosphate phosphatase CheZ